MTIPFRGKLTALRLAFLRHGITDRDDMLNLAAEHVGRPLTTTGDLNNAEITTLTDRLDALPNGPLRSHAARLREATAADPIETAIAVLRAAGMLHPTHPDASANPKQDP